MLVVARREELPRLLSRARAFATVHLRSPTFGVKVFSMLTSIGTALDVTAEEVHIESYFPADDVSERGLRALSS